MGGGKQKPSTGSWEHTIIWVNNDDPVWVRGSEFRDEGCCTDARMYLDACLQGEEVLVLLLEQSGDVAVFEIVFKFWTDLNLSDSCVRGRKFGVWETGRIERKGSMSHEPVVKFQNPRRMSLEV